MSHIKCHHCPRTTSVSEVSARLSGWRFYKGPSLTGKELDDVICPVCTGAIPPQELVPSWNMQCRYCDWSPADERELGDEPILTAYEASIVAAGHRCKPMFLFIDPSGKQYRNNDEEFRFLVKETIPRSRKREKPQEALPTNTAE